MNEDPKRPVGDDDYYGANAKFAYYRNLLNNSLKGKNPKGFDDFMNAVGEASRKDYSKRNEFVEGYDFKEYLTPQDLKDILKDDYQDYVSTLKTIREKGLVDNKVKKLYGEKEIDQDVESLAYGKRFATLPAVTSISKKRTRDGVVIGDTEDMFTYDPKQKKVNKITVNK